MEGGTHPTNIPFSRFFSAGQGQRACRRRPTPNPVILTAPWQCQVFPASVQGIKRRQGVQGFLVCRAKSGWDKQKLCCDQVRPGVAPSLTTQGLGLSAALLGCSSASMLRKNSVLTQHPTTLQLPPVFCRSLPTSVLISSFHVRFA